MVERITFNCHCPPIIDIVVYRRLFPRKRLRAPDLIMVHMRWRNRTITHSPTVLGSVKALMPLANVQRTYGPPQDT